MEGTYNGWLVALSVAVAVLASYTALKLALRIAESDRATARLWLAGGATSMGIGIWSMHFIGMLAFSLPISLRYNLTTTLLSLAIAILVSGVAIRIASGQRLSRRRLCLGGVLMGLGIAAMHYIGMSAIEIVPMIHYRPLLVLVSIGIAIGASCVALWCAFHLRQDGTRAVMLGRLAGAVLLGLAISGMHYVGMAASLFGPNSYCNGGMSLNSEWLAIMTAIIAVAVLALTLITDVYSAELALHTRRHAHRLEAVNAQLHHQAMHDPLTGMPNRQLFYERLRSALADAGRDGRRLAAMVLDLDRFKLINDSLGHAAGDEVLCEVGRRLTSALRKGDTVARMGGDEFLVLAVDVRNRDEAAIVAAKIIEALAAPLSLATLEVRTSVSIGISIFPEDGADVSTLLARADEAMYSAKERGGNSFRCFAAEMNSNAAQRLHIENDLRQALLQGRFELFYQPRVDMLGGRIGSVEALIRWRHPLRGLILPRDFIGIAEETGLILPIGQWVLQEACRQARAWQMSGLALRVAVNLSAVQFRQPNLLGMIRATLGVHHLPPRLLEIELTETALMTNAEQSVATLEHLSRTGVVISVDDFGTGYSSISYLRRFPIDRLKLDGSFVQGLGDDAQSQAIVQAIISLAHSLKMKVIAEGVETREQLAQLKALGCDQWQGYYFGVPEPAATIEAAIRAARPAAATGGDLAATISRLTSAPVKG